MRGSRQAAGKRLTALGIVLAGLGLACGADPPREVDGPTADLPLPDLDPALAEDFTLAGVLRHATVVAETIGDRLARNETWANLSVTQARSADLHGAIETVERIHDPTTRSNAFEDLAWLADEEHLDRSEVEGRWKASRGELPFLYRAEWAAREGEFDRARVILEELSPAVLIHYGSFLSGTAQRQARSGDVQGARRTAAALAGTRDEEYAYLVIVEAQAEAGDPVGARETLGMASFGFHAAVALAAIARAEAAAGDAASARATAERAALSFRDREVPGTDSAARPVAEALARSGGLEEAELFARGPGAGRVEVLAVVAGVAAERGDDDRATRLFDETVERATHAGSPLEVSFALQAVLWAQADAGLHEAARDTGLRLLAMEESSGLAYLAKLQARHGDIEGALAVRDLIPPSKRWDRARAARNIAATCASRHEVETTKRIEATATSALERTWTLIGYADGLLASGTR